MMMIKELVPPQPNLTAQQDDYAAERRTFTIETRGKNIMDHGGVVAFRLGITTVSLVREMSFVF